MGLVWFLMLVLEKEFWSDCDFGIDNGLDGIMLFFMCDSFVVEDGVD